MFSLAVLGQRQSSLLMLSDPGHAEIRDGDIPEDTIPLQVAVNLGDITQNGPVSCSEARSACASWMAEAAGTLQRNLPWSGGKDL